MKKTLKKSLSLALALLIALSLCVSSFAAVSVSQAKQTALEAAGVSKDSAVFTKCTQSQNGTVMLKFTSDGVSYECNVSANGKIKRFFVDTNEPAGFVRLISANEAKKIALNAVNETTETVKKLSAIYSFDEFSGAVYTVTFDLDQRECTYVISAQSGDIISYGYETFTSFDGAIGQVFSVLLKVLNYIFKIFLS